MLNKKVDKMKVTPNPILFKVLNRGRLEGATTTAFILLLLFLLFGCSSQQKKYEIDPKLQPYVTQFEKISNRKIDNLIVKFSFLSKETIAQCRNRFTPVIEVNSRFVKEISNPAEIELIMFHELGHCILLRDHSNSMDSIMYPHLINVNDYLSNYKLYISELFGIEYNKEFDGSVYDTN